MPAGNLDLPLEGAWRDLQSANPDLVRPFFCPEFTRIIASVRSDVEVAVAEDTGRIAAFFPFQRSRRSLAIPVGGIISDYQGIICAPDFLCNPLELLKACSVSAWDFDHLLASQRSFAPFYQDFFPSPQIHLASGYEAYIAERRSAASEKAAHYGSSGSITNILSRARRLEREIGPLRFVSHTQDVMSLNQVLAWKSGQYRNTSNQDLFQMKWIREAVERVHATQEQSFAGMLSVLYAGDRMVAGHFGMRSQTIWHYWFPAYDAQMAKYSPGLVLLLKMAEHAHLLGLHTIDLGKGMSVYKERLMNTSVPLASGSVGVPSWLTLRRRAQKWLRARVKNSPLATPARSLVHWARRDTSKVLQ